MAKAKAKALKTDTQTAEPRPVRPYKPKAIPYEFQPKQRHAFDVKRVGKIESGQLTIEELLQKPWPVKDGPYISLNDSEHDEKGQLIFYHPWQVDKTQLDEGKRNNLGQRGVRGLPRDDAYPVVIEPPSVWKVMDKDDYSTPEDILAYQQKKQALQAMKPSRVKSKTLAQPKRPPHLPPSFKEVADHREAARQASMNRKAPLDTLHTSEDVPIYRSKRPKRSQFPPSPSPEPAELQEAVAISSLRGPSSPPHTQPALQNQTARKRTLVDKAISKVPARHDATRKKIEAKSSSLSVTASVPSAPTASDDSSPTSSGVSQSIDSDSDSSTLTAPPSCEDDLEVPDCFLTGPLALKTTPNTTPETSPSAANSPSPKPKPKAFGDESLIDLWQEENFHTRSAIRIHVPDMIKSFLVDDWEYVTKNGQLVKLPHPQPVNKLIDDYLEEERAKRHAGSGDETLLVETLEGLKLYFDACLGRILLYKYERVQYAEARKLYVNVTEGEWKDKGPGDLYGAEHLARLIGKYWVRLYGLCVSLADSEMQSRCLSWLPRRTWTSRRSAICARR